MNNFPRPFWYVSHRYVTSTHTIHSNLECFHLLSLYSQSQSSLQVPLIWEMPFDHQSDYAPSHHCTTDVHLSHVTLCLLFLSVILKGFHLDTQHQHHLCCTDFRNIYILGPIWNHWTRSSEGGAQSILYVIVWEGGPVQHHAP